ncbi:hypothetical protein, partial [Nonomuraea cypriaca]|uniref:hypothetical protein n=1 Tax=Nonomuraea cypriaca TaxID=1187855 RepID=UPI001A9C6FB6
MGVPGQPTLQRRPYLETILDCLINVDAGPKPELVTTNRLARKICHGNGGKIRQAYREGQEDPLTEIPQGSPWSTSRSTDSDHGLLSRFCRASPRGSGFCCHL